ncbi:MAG: CBS domain-containing protein [Bacteroidetes bacterium]|nr:MAG: CBS domain-containing protein [Bacteroidota bacterium]
MSLGGGAPVGGRGASIGFPKWKPMNASTYQIRQLMSPHVVVARPHYSLAHAIRLMFQMNIHHLPVVDAHNRLVGIFSSNDALRAYTYLRSSSALKEDGEREPELTVEDFMTRNPHVVSPDDHVEVAVGLFNREKIHSLPVVENGKLVGILTAQDLIRFLDFHTHLIV